MCNDNKMNEILELIALVYWHENEDCGADFDPVSCKGGDLGPCHNYDFCKKYDEVKNRP